jgi:probable F420-dependent oxidoreductase
VRLFLCQARAVRFGVSVSAAATGVEWREKALRYEAAGFEYLQVADHVGFFDPFAAAVAAADATSRLRVGSLVLNTGFWNPLLLARAAVTAALLTDGRFVLGLGAGHAQAEFEQAGLDYPPAGERVRRLAGVLRAVRHLSQGETVTDPELGLRQAELGLPATRLPLLVGGNGRGVLAVAGRDADMVSLVGFTSGTGQTHTDLSHWSWDGLADRIELVRAAARGRSAPPHIHILVQFAALTTDPLTAVSGWAGQDDPMPERHLDSPFILVGDEEQIAAHLGRLERLGVASITVFEHSADAVTRILAQQKT